MPAKSFAIHGTLIEIWKFETILAHFSRFKTSVDLQLDAASLSPVRVIVHQYVNTDAPTTKEEFFGEMLYAGFPKSRLVLQFSSIGRSRNFL